MWYDPAIWRFKGIEPVTNFSIGLSVACDNNPIYCADSSGANGACYICSDSNENGVIKRFFAIFKFKI